MEYKLLPHDEYHNYRYAANNILEKVSHFFKISFVDITYRHIISYFESHYKILFNFFDYDPHAELYNGLLAKEPSIENIRYKGLVHRKILSYQSQEICKKISGMTMSETHGLETRYVIYVNQHNRPLGNILFTIFHELTHIFCHYENNFRRTAYASLYSNETMLSTSNYPPELEAFEDEANTVASILLLNDQIMAKILENKLSYSKVLQIYGISGKALFNRVKNYLIYNFNHLPHIALKLALNYQQGGNLIFGHDKIFPNF